jgi:hypothetical protein
VSPPNQRGSKGGGRLLGLGAFAAIVALAILYLGDCMPGFGAGGSSAPASSTPSAPRTDAAPNEAADTIQLTVDGEQCRRGSDAPSACPDLCGALAAESKARKVLVDATLGTHAAVEALRRCLGEQGFRDIVVRTE